MDNENNKSSKSEKGCGIIGIIVIVLLVWIVPGLIHGKEVGEILQSQFESAFKIGITLLAIIGLIYLTKK